MAPRLTNYGLCACVLVCLMVAPPMVSWMGDFLSSSSEIMLDLRGMDIPAVYRTARKNDDGSIDLTINIPASVNVLTKILDRQEQIKYNMTAPMTQTHSPRNRGYPEEDDDGDDIRRTIYPLTLDTPFLINSPALCWGVHPLHVLVIVHTATGNFQRRRLIRETWAGKNLMKTRNLRVLFLLGLTANATAQRLIENEQRSYSDLLQGQFKDTYHNLTHKGVMAYRWIHRHCLHAQIILKVDDDMFINPFLFYHSYFPNVTRLNRTIACHVRPVNTSPIQRGKGKWMVLDFEFRGYKHYPVSYCNGYVVIITPDIIKAMFSAAYTTPFFWVDDVYLYGMLPDKVGNVTYMKIQQSMTLNSNTALKCYRKHKCGLLAAAVNKQSALAELWRLALDSVPPALKPDVNPAYFVT